MKTISQIESQEREVREREKKTAASLVSRT